MINISKKSIVITSVAVIMAAAILTLVFTGNNFMSKAAVSDNIVFLGDSITESFSFDEYFPDKEIINSGVWGDSTSDAIFRLESDVLTYYPSQVFILLDINDIGSDIKNHVIADNIKGIVSAIQDSCP